MYNILIAGEPLVTGKRHAILDGFEETDLLPFGGLLNTLKIDAGVEIPLTIVPQFPVYPPETAWMKEPKTNIAGVVISSKSTGGRVIFLLADIDRQFGLNNLPDHGNLLKNIVRWAAKDSMPLTVEGAGLLDCHLYKQPGRMVLHLVNLTSAATWRAPLDELIAIGPMNVQVKLSHDVVVKSIKTLVSNQKIVSSFSAGWIQFTVDKILDHECVVIS
jgi:hypothetical protein